MNPVPTPLGYEGWSNVAERFGLRLDPARGLAWTSRTDGASLVLEVEVVDTQQAMVTASAPCPPGLVVMRRRHALAGAEHLTTGDAAFDGAVFFHDPDPTRLGLLDAATRAALFAFVAAGGVARRGAFVLSPVALAVLGAKVELQLEAMLALARRFAATDDERQAGIVALVRGDPNDAVRRALRERFASSPAVRALAAAAEPAHAGPDAHDRGLAARLVDPWEAHADRVAAVARLLAHGAPNLVAPLLPNLPRELVGDAVTELARLVVAGQLPTQTGLVYVAHVDYHPALNMPQRVALLDALGTRRDPHATGWLTAACDAAAPDLFAASLRALVRIEPAQVSAVHALSPGARERATRLLPDLVLADPSLGADFLAALLPLVEREAHGLRRRYLTAFAAVGDARFADVVTAALGAPDEATRDAAIDALGVLGGPAHVERLAALPDRPRVRAAIAAIQTRVGAHLRGGVTLGDEATTRGRLTLDG